MRLYKYSRKEKKEKTARYRLASLTLSFPAKQLSLLPHNHDTRFFHIFKTYFNKKLQQPAFHNEPGFNDIDKIEQLCADHVLHCRWSLDALISHSYHGEKCSSPHLRYYQQYSRHYITFHHTVEDHILDVHVYLCESDGHFHAVLPSVFITPYSPYSIFFVLRVLFLKNHSK